jgi:hypothetical protein
MILKFLVVAVYILFSFNTKILSQSTDNLKSKAPFLVVLGISQDG